MEQFDAAFARIVGRFGQVEPRRRARWYLLGLLADVETRSATAGACGGKRYCNDKAVVSAGS